MKGGAVPRRAFLYQALGVAGTMMASPSILTVFSKKAQAQGPVEAGSLEALWKKALPIRRAILVHPFLVGLGSGDLAREAFSFYILQDSLYLQAYAKVLNLAAAKAPRLEWSRTFNAHALNALEEERAMHGSLFKELGISSRRIEEATMAPTNKAYTSYLLATAGLEPFPHLLGALLPCYWIYLEVGKALQKKGSPNPLYQKWIDTYASGNYEGVVREVLGMAQRTLARASGEEARVFQDRFMTSCRYEWMFWDMAFRMEAWPL